MKKLQLLLEVVSQLNFDGHKSKMCNKSPEKLNTPCRIGYSGEFEEQKILIDTFIYLIFSYCPLVWRFSSKIPINKRENIQKENQGYS